MQRVVLAFSGSLETSAAIPWLAEKYRTEVVAATLDFGQGVQMDDVRERALVMGAVRAHVFDVREEFARDYLLPALQAGAMSDGRLPLATALSRPLIAKYLVTVAQIEGANAVAHAATDERDHARIEAAVRAIDSSIRVISATKAWKMSPADQIECVRQRGLGAPAPADPSIEAETTLWGRWVTGPAVDDTWQSPSEDVYLLTKAAADAPDTPAFVEFEFARGVPVEINGIEMPPVELLQCLETIAGAHGVGRFDLFESKAGGAKTRRVCEAPAAVPLQAAYQALQAFVTPADLAAIQRDLGKTSADLIDAGAWPSPIREPIDAFVAKAQERVSGNVRLRLFKGGCDVVGVKSPNAVSDRIEAPAASTKSRRSADASPKGL
jgi:argininosuccinate synthase